MNPNDDNDDDDLVDDTTVEREKHIIEFCRRKRRNELIEAVFVLVLFLCFIITVFSLGIYYL